MKLRFLSSALLLLLLPALDTPAASFRTDLDLSAGYRVDRFNWNVTGDVSGLNPNVLSEYTWSDLETLQVRGGS